MSFRGREFQRSHEHKFCEGPLKYKMPGGHTWKSVWGVIEGCEIHVYDSIHKVKENRLGTIDIKRETSVHVKHHDKKKGYRFDVSTGKQVNSFSTESMSLLEQWRAYIVGLATGKVPKDIDLLPKDLHKIQSDIDYYIKHNDHNRDSTVTNDSGLGASIDDNSSYCRETEITGDSDLEECSSWYFGYCSRDEAERILINGTEYGNTLMRKKPSSPSGKRRYAISKCIHEDGSRNFEHYKVFETNYGFKIDVQNMDCELKSLSDVMDRFVHETGGPKHTRPMVTNDSGLLGYIRSPYVSKILPRAPENKDTNRLEPSNDSISTCINKSDRGAENSNKSVEGRPLPPLPCSKTAKAPRPFFKANSEGQFKGLRPLNYHPGKDNGGCSSEIGESSTTRARSDSLHIRAYERTTKHTQDEGNEGCEFQWQRKTFPRRNSEPSVDTGKTSLQGLTIKQQLASLFSGQLADTERKDTQASYITACEAENHIYAVPDNA